MGSSFLLAVAAQQQRRSRRRRPIRRAMQGSINWVAPKIPEDLLIEILARLPAKSVMRFKCMSKFWSSLFSSKYFCNLFHMLPSPPQPRLYMCIMDRSNCSKCVLLSSSPSTCPCYREFDQDFTIRNMGGFFLRLVRGFICFTVSSKRDGSRKARIYNPSTRQVVILPGIKSNIFAERNCYSNFYFMCYDPVHDQYKILATITEMSEDMQKVKSELWVFVLESGGSWRRVAEDFHPHLASPFELTTSGVLYFLAWTGIHTCMLVRFDVRSEELYTMQVPREAGDVVPRHRKKVTPINYGGKVAVIDFTFLHQTGTANLWVVEDWSKQEWSSKILVLPPSQKHLVNYNHLLLKGTSLKGKVVFVPRMLIYPFYFIYYDLHTNDLNKVDVKGIPDRWFRKPEEAIYCDMDFMNPSENIKYLET